MGTAKYIGRVGGLAVALGVGIAVATTPGVAWADDTVSASSGGTNGTAGATGTSGTSEPQGTSTTTGTTSEPAGTSTVGGYRDGGRLQAGVGFGGRHHVRHLRVDGRIGAAGAAGDGECHRRRAVVKEVEQRHLSKGRCGGGVSTEDSTLPKLVADPTATDPEAPAAAKAPVRGPRAGSDSNQRRVDEPTGAPRVDANTLTATGERGTVAAGIPQPPRTVVDVAVHAACRATACHGGHREDVLAATG